MKTGVHQPQFQARPPQILPHGLAPVAQHASAIDNSCGDLHERDLNAALNLEKAGFELPGAGRGDLVRPAMPAEVCETSRESVVESWDPAKLEYQVSSDSE